MYSKKVNIWVGWNLKRVHIIIIIDFKTFVKLNKESIDLDGENRYSDITAIHVGPFLFPFLSAFFGLLEIFVPLTR